MVRYQFDIIVVGAGHAGTEAALAAARLGANVALLTTNLDTVGQMSCNPAIGGVAKGHLVREIDALGGIMGRAIDDTGIQFRMLNLRKGPAMHSPRAQADKKAYQNWIKFACESQPNLTLRQEIVEDLLTEKIDGASNFDERIIGVQCRGDAKYLAESVILTTGTFLQAVMHTGEAKVAGGRAGEGTTKGISGALNRLGFRLERFKTGTPPRLNARSIDFSKSELQPGDENPQPFSFLNNEIKVEQIPCWITYTNSRVHEIIRRNLDRAPMYSGEIHSSGPRYCPSIEDKIVRFADKDRHQVFLEPEGRQTNEVYVNGISTSLPRDVQDQIFREIPGLENAEIMRYGYAVEYDFCPPDQLQQTLETKSIGGLYFAGQINGTTGYEEAAGQGLMAGANAALKLANQPPLIIDRNQGYLGVLIDDLVTCSVDEPYRMFTSRAEFRLLLRQDNADRRLTPIAHQIGLIDQERWSRLESKESAILDIRNKMRKSRIGQHSIEKYLRRPDADWNVVCQHLPEASTLPELVKQQVINDIKYAGYIDRQLNEVERHQRMAGRKIPEGLNYESMQHMRSEAREKLTRFRPRNLEQASRISGITPADIALIVLHLDGKVKS